MTSHHNKPAWINDPGDIFLDGYLKFYFVRQDRTRWSGNLPCSGSDKPKKIEYPVEPGSCFFE
jgi:hypothetical protein